MIRVLKTLLLWLLIAVLPVQGFAAVMKASCGSTHHSPLRVVMEHEHHHDDSTMHSHHHDDASMHSVAESSSSGFLATADKASGTYESSYCSACAACCFGAVAPPSALTLLPAYSSSEAVVVSPTPLVTGYIPGGLERPPRAISA
jgi:hypothetical protein